MSSTRAGKSGLSATEAFNQDCNAFLDYGNVYILVVAEPAERPEGHGGGDWGGEARSQSGVHVYTCTSI